MAPLLEQQLRTQKKHTNTGTYITTLEISRADGNCLFLTLRLWNNQKEVST